ncbi:MAG: Alkaline phosphatase synthesis transcriptional regulatory protein PhoP [Syntrophorhabdus sp. PtaB.Bin047]|jgi:sigma-B regulation protein RsbU (phosphoserine phosphatase)|nr:MAG: Alkaline phosphatase synthesis transcriptional regulatory protein PhoP [Syntrophorhabdus sp. PtaB.Bin047]
MKEKILIVDDSEDIRVLLKRILAKTGYDVTEATGGEEALFLAEAIRPDLVLLDIVMPGMDGFTVCEELGRKGLLTDVPVIFLSARSDTADKVRGLETGGSDYITKPFEKAEVLARVENQLKIRRLTCELKRSNARLSEKQAVLDEDLRAAAGIQQSLLPRTVPDIESLVIAWKFMPSHVIGGDMFNVFRLDEDHVGMYMIDVSGHGVPSALITVSVSQALEPNSGRITKERTYEAPGYRITSPGRVMEALDREYPIERFGKYFTIVYLVINTRTGAVTYSNAAHPSPLIVRGDGSMEPLDKGGTIIGLDGRLPFEEEEKSLRKGDRVVLFTDGVVEYQDSSGEFFGENRLYSLLSDLRNEGVEALLDTVVSAIQGFGKGAEVQDDITLVALEYTGSAEERNLAAQRAPARDI